MDHQLFVERILENESLTGDLEDGPAAQLLEWGIGYVPALVQDLEDAELAGAQVNRLMALMRRLNRVAGNLVGATAEDWLADLPGLVDLHQQVFPQALAVSAEELEATAASLVPLMPDQSVPFLLSWLTTKLSKGE